MDGIGIGSGDAGDAVAAATTPVLDSLMTDGNWCTLAAHGIAVGMPSNDDMGNSEVGHNAMGAGRILTKEPIGSKCDHNRRLVDITDLERSHLKKNPSFYRATQRWKCS